jgi:hypothetical protein
MQNSLTTKHASYTRRNEIRGQGLHCVIRRKSYTTHVLWRLVFGIRVTVKWGNILLSSAFCALLGVLETHSVLQGSVVIELSGMHGKYCDMLLTLGAYISGAGPAAGEYMLR